MTQMLLFDAATTNSSVAPVINIAPAIKAVALSPVAEEPAAVEEHVPGLNHIGDLARLVLLRHDLAAARRAKRGRRSAK